MGGDPGQSAGTFDGASSDGDMLSSMSRTVSEREPSRPEWPDPPFPVGRYVVTAPIGRGAAGVVYRAYDPELDRAIAIKLVVPRSRSDRAHERLLQEAQAIARLNHPHVVSVFDVGTVRMPRHEGDPIVTGVYMVMELVEGVTLRRWLRAKPRRWTDVLAVLIAAGRGLEAAHRASLVHRDFKPDNVLIGEDGRARVLDFGLAQTAASTGSGDSMVAEPRAAIEIAGTPAYMAPEQHEGGSTDARTDLFAFCVTCWEALYGAQPFAGRTLDDLARSKEAGPALPRGRKGSVPGWLHDVIAGGLAVDPGQRPASMGILIDRFERGRNRRRNLWITAGATALIGGAVAIAWARGGDAQRCIDEGEDRIAAVWNDDARTRGREAFEASGVPYAGDAWSRVEGVFDARMSAWREHRAQACSAAVGDGGESTAVEHGAAALMCLDRRLDEVAARIDMMRMADRDMIRHAVVAAERTPKSERCLDAAWVAREPVGNAGSIDAAIMRAHVQHDLGHYDDAIAAARAAVDESRTVDDRIRLARAQSMLCRSHLAGRRHRDVQAVCTDSWIAAERAGIDGLAIAAMTELLGAAKLDETAEADRLAKLIEARIDGLSPDDRDPSYVSDFSLVMAARMREAGQWREARTHAQRAHDEMVAARGPEDPAVVPSINELALIATSSGELARAREHLLDAHAKMVAGRGAQHPDVVSIENNLSGQEIALGEYEAAIERLERVLAAKEALEGPRSPWLLTSLFRMVEAYSAVDRGAEALARGRRALDIAEGVYGRDSVELLSPLVSLSRALRSAGECDEALAVLERADTIVRASGARDVELAAFGEGERARCLEAVGRTEEAGVAFERAVALAEEFHGPNARPVADALLVRGRWERAHGSSTRARELLARAREICRATQGDPELTRAIDAELAR